MKVKISNILLNRKLVFWPSLRLADSVFKRVNCREFVKAYIKPGVIVSLVRPPRPYGRFARKRYTAEVLFPGQEKTDLVSPDFLYDISDPELNLLLELEAQERSKTNEDSRQGSEDN